MEERKEGREKIERKKSKEEANIKIQERKKERKKERKGRTRKFNIQNRYTNQLNT